MDSVLVLEVPGPDVRLVPVRNVLRTFAKTKHGKRRRTIPGFFVQRVPTRPIRPPEVRTLG